MAIVAVYFGATELKIALEAQDRRETRTFDFPADPARLFREGIVPWLSQSPLGAALIVSNLDLAAKDTVPDPRASLVHSLADQLGASVRTIDPADPEECLAEARITGTPELVRDCRGDLFVLRYLARQEAEKRQLDLGECRFIVGHLDREIHLGALRGATLLDICTSSQEGPFALGEQGGVPFGFLLELCERSKDRQEVLKMISAQSGLRGYLGLESPAELAAAAADREYAALIQAALVYQIAKEIGAFAAVLQGRPDGIVLGGEFTQSPVFVEALAARVGFLGPISLYPGDQRLAALGAGARRILSKEGE